MRKYYLIAELLIFEHRRKNISVSNAKSSLVRKWRCVVRTCSTSRDRWWCRLLWAVCGIPTCSSLIKVQKWIASIIETASACSHSQSVWRLLYFSTGQRFCPQGAWDRAAFNLWNTTDFIAPAVWPADSPDLNPVHYQTWGSIAARMHVVE